MEALMGENHLSTVNCSSTWAWPNGFTSRTAYSEKYCIHLQNRRCSLEGIHRPVCMDIYIYVGKHLYTDVYIYRCVCVSTCALPCCSSTAHLDMVQNFTQLCLWIWTLGAKNSSSSIHSWPYLYQILWIYTTYSCICQHISKIVFYLHVSYVYIYIYK